MTEKTQSKPKFTFKEQVALLQRCIKKNLDLHDELVSIGRDYDSFVYKFNVEPLVKTAVNYKTIDDLYVPKKGVPVISFFSGCGGLDLGFEAAGFDLVAAIDNNQLFCRTLRLNRPGWNIIGPPDFQGDISQRETLLRDLKKSAQISKPFEGVFTGGPPCQPFSVAASQRFRKSDQNFKRIGFSHNHYGNLLFDYIWLIKKLQPLAFLIENVPGLSTIDDGEQLGVALRILTESGYRVTNPTILNAADFEVPQNRQRIFIVGSRTSEEFVFLQKSAEQIPCMKALEPPPTNLKNHLTRRHKASSIERYMHLKYGERDKLGRVDRLDPNLPSKTVIAGGARGGGRSHLHPAIPRTLSVRECARLQTFPDTFEFKGSTARQFTQVGNAVPPVLAFKLAKQMLDSFSF